VAAAKFARKSAQVGKRAGVSLVITTDEEWAAVNGTRRVLEWMGASGRRPAGFVVGEPSSEEHLGEAIKVGRRGSLCGLLHAGGVQGHAAYPGLFQNSNRALGLAIAILHAYRWDDGEEGMPATNFETIAIESGDFDASAIVPGGARALWNIRFTHHETPLTLTRKLLDQFNNPPQWAQHHPDAQMLLNLRLTANSDTAAMSYYSPPGALSALAGQVVLRHTGHAPALDCKGGTTDGRFIHGVFPHVEIIELGLPECGGLRRAADPKTFGKAGGMHQVDECCSIADLDTLTRCYHDLLAGHAEAAR
jgi:succinyl-diaminopimelate desuccinylase